jgi:hippurate hydrolase
VPSVFWYFGGLDPEYLKKAESDGRLDEIPSNHSPLFAPIVESTLTTPNRKLALRCRQ